LEGDIVLSRVVYKKQRGRRVATTVAAVGLLVGTVLINSTVLAVHDEGVFQMDGNAITSPAVSPENNPVSNTTGAHDWDQVYADRNFTGSAPFPTSGAQSQAFVTDVFGAGDSIFTGGSTKDIYDPQNSWLWRQTGTTSVQDKDDIEHAFAAQYSVDRSGATQSCGTGSNGQPISTANCVLLYFGADRFSNSGNTTMGFWFFKNKVSPNALPAPLPTGGTAGFTGHHTARTTVGGVVTHGDILILSDFLIGGAAPTVTVFEWVGSGGSDGPIDRIGGGAAIQSSCTQAAAPKQNATPVPPVTNNDNLCATTNAGVVTSPWPFTPKANSGGTAGPGGSTTKFGISEFMEGGINMTALGIGNECFNTFLAETRASSSPTSTLSDFAIGNFGSCNATAVTTPSAGAAGVSPGTEVTDHFVVTGHSSGGTPPTPSSSAALGGHNVAFSYCGPIPSPDLCNSSDAAHTPIAIPPTQPLATVSAGVADATSAAINTSSSPLAPGRYCFIGSWAGDNNYPDGASDSSAGECFTVRTIPTTTVTTPSDSGGTALTGTQPLGTVLYDVAVVSADTAGGGPVTGTVDFFICKPGETTGAAGAEVCATGGTALADNPRTLVAVSPATTPPSASIISSPGVTANAAGVYCFRAVYTPTGSTYTGSSDARHSECVTVGPENTNTVTTPRVTGSTTTFTTGPVNSSVTDHAVVTATDSADGTPTGTIKFFICSPTQTTGAAGSQVCATGGTELNTATADAVAGSSPPASSADSTAVIANVVGTWCFRAEYTPSGTNGANYNASSDARHTECFTITDSTGTTSTQTWLPNDSATITSVGGTALSGTLSFSLYDSDTCTGTILYQEDTDAVTAGVQPYSFTNAASPVIRSTHNSSVSVTASKTVSWLVTFTSNNTLVAGSSHCEKTALTITN
jgi:hypothetical protein